VVSRAFPLVVALAVALGVGSGCASTQQDFQRAFTPGQLKEGSHIHAFNAASLAYTLTDGHMVGLDARLGAVLDDVPPFFDALDKAGYRFDVDIVAHTNDAGGFKYDYYDVNLVLSPKSGKGETFVLPGAEGTRMTRYAAGLVPAALRTKVPAEVLRRGHFAIYALATMSSVLNATDEIERRHTFGVLVLKEKLRQKEPNADYIAPLRKPEESLEDIDLALRVLAEHHRAMATLRAEVLGTLAMVRAYELPQARAALEAQAAESRKRAAQWESTHKRPTMEDYGVGVKSLVLPTPENMLAVLDKDGYLTAAVKVAKGIATGSPSATIEGFAKLAPENSSLRIAAEGTAAALRGDVAGTASAVLALAEKQEDVAEIATRLRSFEAAATDLRARAKSAIAMVPTSVDDAKNRVTAAALAEGRKQLDDATKATPLPDAPQLPEVPQLPKAPKTPKTPRPKTPRSGK
jgi:hypothetical protein